MTNTDAITEIADITITQIKYIVIIGIPVELGGRISDISKLNMTTERRIVISKDIWLEKAFYL
jgi:hypothetical protein